MKRFFVTVTGKDKSPIGYDNMMMDCENMETAMQIAVDTVSEQMGFPVECFCVSAQEKASFLTKA